MSTSQENTAHALDILPAIFRNPAAEATCQTCTEPVWPGDDQCRECRARDRAYGLEVADRVVPLTYAGPQNEQAQTDLWQYKNGPEGGRVLAAHRLVYLVWYAAWHHGACIDRVASRPVSVITSVPSGHVGHRSSPHPVERITGWRHATAAVELKRVRDATPRATDPDSIRVAGDVSGQHVALFDDTWTTGASSQGAAIALKRAGAAEVSIIVVGRWLNASWPPVPSWLASHPQDRWNPTICPVTRGACPAP